MTEADPSQQQTAQADASQSGRLDPERRDLIAMLQRHRGFLLTTVRDLTDEQASSRPTVSQLSLAGLIKHVATTERNWARFAAIGADTMNYDISDPAVIASFENGFRMVEGETLAGLIENYAQVAAETDALVASIPDLSVEHALPQAPWFEEGAAWSVRRVFMHIVAEISQHSGHADILRETIDGAKTMG